MFELWFLRYLTNIWTFLWTIWTFLWAIFDILMDNFVRSDERKNMSSGLIICCELSSSTFYSNEAWNRMEFTDKSFFTRSLLSYKSSAIAFGHVSVYVLTTAARPVLCTVGLSATFWFVLFRVFFSTFLFIGKKKYCSVRTKKLHKMKLKKHIFFSKINYKFQTGILISKLSL